MKIIIDNKIPYIKGALEPFATIEYLAGKDTTAEIAKNADAIITRTRTKCNRELLQRSAVKMIATATIGFDHIDTEYCSQAGIEWTNAPGCNSWSVAQYIMATLYTLANEKNFTLTDKTIGIIGAGNVGSKVANLCRIIGMKVMVNDPLRQKAEGNTGFSSIEEIQQNADIITIHTPLTREGEDKTYHLIDNIFLQNCKPGLFFINSARGEVMNTKSVLSAIENKKIDEVIIDCWEDEPHINTELLQKAFIATPHIAGYSKDGKANGTQMSVQAISKKFNLGIDNWTCKDVELPSKTTIEINGTKKTEQEIISEAILFTYPIKQDSNRLKESPITFEKQRGEYPVRREFPTFTILGQNINIDTISKLQAIGFKFQI